MPEVLSPPSRPAALPFSEFLGQLFQALPAAGVRPCVLRNYQDFPARNIGNDIDLLIAPSALPSALRALRSLSGVRIAGYSERPSVANVLLAGISQQSESRALEIDFDLSLTWKGLPYLSTEEVLEAAIPHPAGDATFFAPAPVHEAIVSLFASLLIGGWLKEKYFPRVRQTFAANRSEVIAALSPSFGMKLSAQLADAVIAGDRSRMTGLIRPLRRALLLRSLRRRPLRAMAAIVRHYGSELCFRHAPQSRESVSILSPGASSQLRLAEALLPRLQSVAVKVESKTEVVPARRGFGLWIAALRWGMEEWRRALTERKDLTLTLREGGWPACPGLPAWLARLAASLTPSPDLCILLEPRAGLNSAESRAESAASLEACRAFLKSRKRSIILDAGRPAESVAEDASAAILDALAQRATKRLEKRFPPPRTPDP